MSVGIRPGSWLEKVVKDASDRVELMEWWRTLAIDDAKELRAWWLSRTQPESPSEPTR